MKASTQYLPSKGERSHSSFVAATTIALGVAANCIAFSAAAAPIGPVYPPPGGVTFSSSGGSAGNAGGVNFNFSSFSPGSFSELYWGASSSNLPSAGLDGILHAMNFISFSGTQATWETTSNWYNPSTFLTTSETIRLTITISGLGATPWVSANAPAVGLPAALGAVVDDSLGSNFVANIAFTVPTEGGLALNSLQQLPSCNSQSCAQSNFGGGFYYEPPQAQGVPEPGSIGLAGLGLVGLAVVRRRVTRTEQGGLVA